MRLVAVAAYLARAGWRGSEWLIRSLGFGHPVCRSCSSGLSHLSADWYCPHRVRLFMLQVTQGGALRWHRPRHTVRIDTRGRNEPVNLALSHDVPVIVVKQHVVMPAKEHPVDQIGASVIAFPLLGVVRLGPGRRRPTLGPEAAAVSSGEGNALIWAEQSLLPPEVDGLPALVEGNRHRPEVHTIR